MDPAAGGVLMNDSKALLICENLGSTVYSDTDKARAIHQVLFGRMPLALRNAELLAGIAKWLFSRIYIFDI